LYIYIIYISLHIYYIYFDISHIYIHIYIFIHKCIYTFTLLFIHIYIHIYTYICTYTYIFIHTYMYIYTHMHKYIYIHKYTYILIHRYYLLYVHMYYINTCTYIHTHTYIYTYAYTFIYIYIFTYIHCFYTYKFIYIQIYLNTYMFIVEAKRVLWFCYMWSKYLKTLRSCIIHLKKCYINKLRNKAKSKHFFYIKKFDDLFKVGRSCTSEKWNFTNVSSLVVLWSHSCCELAEFVLISCWHHTYNNTCQVKLRNQLCFNTSSELLNPVCHYVYTYTGIYKYISISK